MQLNLGGERMKLETVRKVYAGKSRANAVKLFCRECMGYDGHRNGGESLVSYKEASFDVAKCNAEECPLHP